MSTPSDRPTFAQTALHHLTRLTLGLMARVKITGRENIPQQGPLLIVANHLSTIDPLLMNAVLPNGTRFVGPGDFKLLFPANVFLRLYRVIQVKRSLEFDRSSLTAMSSVLKSGGMLLIFPEGGTWEKAITDVKPGAAYLSLSTGAPILPIGLGGAYQSWYKVARLQRPRLTVNIGPVIPAIKIANRSERAAALEAASQMIMQRIYDLLPDADRAWYDDMARRRYDLAVDVTRDHKTERYTLPGGEVLSELMQKPNLISPLVRNAHLPLDPFRYPGTAFTADSVRLAATLLRDTLQNTYRGYIEYRLGEAKAQALFGALTRLIELTDSPGLFIFTPTSRSSPSPA